METRRDQDSVEVEKSFEFKPASGKGAKMTPQEQRIELGLWNTYPQQGHTTNEVSILVGFLSLNESEVRTEKR